MGAGGAINEVVVDESTTFVGEEARGLWRTRGWGGQEDGSVYRCRQGRVNQRWIGGG